uniref:Uncharacterized protein n=1 Tax=Marseillevirus LCMAC101 TaxID=2506602 RepID=A0A481YRS5_9VIRU|nr:MAG: hypothetical protein LCMAC101_05680 [Marseillevirus LCMAC101]
MASTVTKWCQPGKEQYSIDLLDKLKPHEKSLMKVAEKNKGKKGKDIPSRIVINYFTKKYPRPTILQGPWQLEYLVGETPNGIMRVYNLYDTHLLPKKCGKGMMKADEWIIGVLKSADVFVDVFVETAIPSKTFFGRKYIPIKHESRPGALTDFIKKTDTCVKQKKQCPAPNSRIHGVDVRQIGYALEKQIRLAYPDEIDDVTNKVARNLINMSVKILSSTKMQKEIEDLPKCVFTKLIEKFTDNLEKCLLDINKPSMPYKTRIESLWMCIGSILMDTYLLGRLFKTFDVSRERGQPDRVHNAIIYTGSDHSVVYRDVLKSCGFNVVFKNKSSGVKNQCVNIRKMPYPLFRG